MTAALEGGEWSAARPGRTLPPGKTRYPLYRRLGGPQGRSGRAENLVPTGIRTRTLQPIVRSYTDWATRPTFFFQILSQNYEKRLLASSCLSVRLFAWNNSVPTGGIFVKFDSGIFFEKPVVKIQVSLKSDKNNEYSS